MKKIVDTRLIEIRSNIDEFNKRLQKLRKLTPQAANYVVKKIAFGLFHDLIKRSPRQTGRLQHGWDIRKIDEYTYRIFNPTHYIIYVEFGVKGHPLSQDKEKRKRSLRYLFAKGILKSVKVDKGKYTIEYYYTPKVQKVAFIRNTIREWAQKTPKLVRDYLREFIIKTMSGK